MCPAITVTSMIACVRRKSAKIGEIAVTDSFTPRRFITVRRPTPAKANGSLYACQRAAKS
jgi:hypothetical protein